MCKWQNRFDDPQKKYRTLYAAKRAITCLRELLADLRPNPKALQEFENVFSKTDEQSIAVAGIVSAKWRRQHVLAHARPRLASGRLIPVESPTVLKRLEHAHAKLLRAHGFKSLNIPRLRSRDRPITQACARTFYEEGRAGVLYYSRLDGSPCYAFFEGRASLRMLGHPLPMTQNHPDLIRVCGEYTLVLRPA
jgi:hypothetical protein